VAIERTDSVCVPRGRLRALAIGALVTGVTLPGTLLGQNVGSRHDRAPAKLIVAPVLGMYVAPDALISDSMVQYRQTPAAVLGLRVGAPILPGVLLQLGALWSPSVLTEADWLSTIEHAGGIMVASGRARVPLRRATEHTWGFYVAPGAALLRRYGTAWEGMTGRTDAALTLAAGTQLDVGGSSISWVLELEGLVTNARFTEYTGVRRGTGWHRELVVTAGAALPLGSR
jgi:hypothetical protein